MPRDPAPTPGAPPPARSLTVRPVTPADLFAVHALIEAAFARDVAPDFAPEGRRTFRRTASLNALRTRLDEGGLGWVAHAGGALAGYAERRDHHIHLLFVHPDHQRRGVGRALLAALMEGVNGPVTVHAAPAAVAAYGRWGFVATGARRVRDGIAFVPMALAAPPGPPR